MPTTFNLADPPKALPFPEIMLSNQQPLSIERHEIQHALDDALKADGEVNEILKLVHNRRQEYSNHIALLRKALSPCRALPSEIWSRIFCILMDIDNEDKVAPKKTRVEVTINSAYRDLLESCSGKLQPTIAQISLVCRAWRRSALSTPSLWRHLPLEVISDMPRDKTPKFDDEEKWRACYNIALQAHLFRAGTNPLDMCAVIPSWDLDSLVSKEYLEILGTALPRLRSFDLSIMDCVGLSRFASLPQRFDNLQSLEVLVVSVLAGREDQAPETPWQLCDHAPLHSQLKLFYHHPAPLIPMTDCIAFLSSNITHLIVEGSFIIDIYRFLKASPNLIEATFHVHVTSDRVEHIRAIDWDPLENVMCPTLQMLKVTCILRPINIALGKVNAPLLTHLELKIPISGLPTFAFPLAPHSLAHLTVTHLIIANCATNPVLAGQEWVSFFRQVPTITHLSLQQFPKLHILLRSLASVTVDPLLPGLKFLMIIAVSAADDADDAEDMSDPGLWWETQLNAVAAARIQGSPSSPWTESRLASVRITFEESDRHPHDGNHTAFYRLNGWLQGGALSCPAYLRLMDAFDDASVTAAQDLSFLLSAQRFQRDEPETTQVRE